MKERLSQAESRSFLINGRSGVEAAAKALSTLGQLKFGDILGYRARENGDIILWWAFCPPNVFMTQLTYYTNDKWKRLVGGIDEFPI